MRKAILKRFGRSREEVEQPVSMADNASLHPRGVTADNITVLVSGCTSVSSPKRPSSSSTQDPMAHNIFIDVRLNFTTTTRLDQTGDTAQYHTVHTRRGLFCWQGKPDSATTVIILVTTDYLCRAV